MTKGCASLRKALSRLICPPEGAEVTWLDDQVRQLAGAKARHPHSIALHMHAMKADREGNCFMNALGIVSDDVRHLCLGRIFPGADFVASLLTSGLRTQCVEFSKRVDGDVVIYFDHRGRPTHAGICAGGKVVSKWGSGLTHIWKHHIWEIPSEYGDRVEVFRPLTKAKAVSAFEEWANAQ